MRLSGLCGVAAAAVLVPVTGAQAQSAYDINRLNAAMQICNSPAGATMAECAQLRAKLGMAPRPAVALPGGGLGGLAGGNKAAAAAGLLGVLSQARAAAPAPAAAPAVNAAAVQDAIRMCVQNANGNSAAIQACLQIASAARPAAPAAPASPGLGIAAFQAAPAVAAGGGSSALSGGDAAAMAIYRGGQSYQACAAANPSNWQSCLPLLNGGAR